MLQKMLQRELIIKIIVLIAAIVVTGTASVLIAVNVSEGIPGPKGDQGDVGENGKSAYELAVEKGYSGSVNQWLASLVGETGEDGSDGKSAYELAVENGYVGSESEWLEALVGSAGIDGSNGKSAYELAVDNGYSGTLSEWLESLVGEKGEQGIQGEKGEKGDKGDQGEQGIQGEQGEQGIQGEKGEKGDKGDQGEQGIQGAQGEQGIQGEKGEKGDKGDQGEQGIQGEQGEQGIQGEKGEKGDQGDQGEQGIQGEQGEQGIQGEKGEKGDKGDQGEQGIQGAQGEQGIQGEKGEKGDKGDQGEQGIQGEQGEQGIQGEKGEKGDQGDQGIQGAQGEQGIQGEKGEQGIQGETGKSAYEIYLEAHPDYTGTEEEWIEEFVDGTLLKHTVTFDLNGGSATEGFVSSVVVGYGKTVALTTPERSGYTFLGWYTGDSVIDGTFTTTTQVYTDFSLVARWQVNEVTVTFLDIDGNTLKIQTLNWGESASAPTIEKVIGLKRFEKWSADYNSVKENITVQALYVENKYTITFDTRNIASVPSASYYMDTVPDTPADISADGYTLVGWYLDESYKTKYDFSYALNKDTTLYAKFSSALIPVTTLDEFLAIANDTSASYSIENDINCKGETLTPISYFYGTIYGNGHKIYNFSISDTSATAGIIRTNYGTVRDLSFGGLEITISRTLTNENKSYGIICGKNSGTISNCHITDGDINIDASSVGAVTNYNYIGAIAGNNTGTITGCSNNASMDISLTGKNSASTSTQQVIYSYIGGICGLNGGTLSSSQNTGKMSMYTYAWDANNSSSYGRTHDHSNVGGICGRNNSKVTECMSNATIEHKLAQTNSNAYPYSYTGGAFGDNYGEIKNCYAEGSVIQSGSTDYSYLGGFIGINHGKINSCYATSTITDTSGTVTAIGSFIGYNEIESGYSASINKCFATGNMTVSSTATNSGKFIGLSTGSELHCYYLSTLTYKVGSYSGTTTLDTGTAKTSGELMSLEFIEDTIYFDSDIWNIAEGNLPTLKCFD